MFSHPNSCMFQSCSVTPTAVCFSHVQSSRQLYVSVMFSHPDSCMFQPCSVIPTAVCFSHVQSPRQLYVSVMFSHPDSCMFQPCSVTPTVVCFSHVQSSRQLYVSVMFSHPNSDMFQSCSVTPTAVCFSHVQSPSFCYCQLDVSDIFLLSIARCLTHFPVIACWMIQSFFCHESPDVVIDAEVLGMIHHDFCLNRTLFLKRKNKQSSSTNSIANAWYDFSCCLIFFSPVRLFHIDSYRNHSHTHTCAHTHARTHTQNLLA